MVYNFLRAQTQKINIHRLIVLFHTKINSMEKLFILISFELPYFCFDTPLRFWPLLKREGIYRKKLDVITFPLSSSSRGYRRFNGRTTSSKQKALVCPKTAKRAKLNYTYRYSCFLAKENGLFGGCRQQLCPHSLWLYKLYM